MSTPLDSIVTGLLIMIQCYLNTGNDVSQNVFVFLEMKFIQDNSRSHQNFGRSNFLTIFFFIFFLTFRRLVYHAIFILYRKF